MLKENLLNKRQDRILDILKKFRKSVAVSDIFVALRNEPKKAGMHVHLYKNFPAMKLWLEEKLA